MTVRLQNISRHGAAFIAMAALTACSSDLVGANRHAVQFSFTTNASTTPAAAGIRVSPDLVVGPASDLVLNKVQFVVDKIELDRTGDASCVAEIEAAGDDHANAGEQCEDVQRDPVVVDVPVDNTLHAVLNVPLSEGTYAELEAKLEPAPSTATAFNGANPDLLGKSVRIEGTYKGAAFVFTSSVRRSLEMSFDPPLVIDATTKNATVSFDAAKWFLDSNGAVIDPNTAIDGSAVKQQIEDNIRRSFHAFEDEHESGVDDHSGHGG
ncbi:MAG TPA: hypothetical protein VGD02_05315 [Gemmatimonadaceae bacterium]|jgi:hypothetical protein